jgi:pyruvate dehydrogenase E2 component (dihydrolipoamide acetyltransferase)
MASEVTMPRLSDSMEEGTVLKWLVDEGAEVKRGEPLVEIETDKANMTYDADSDGTLVEILAQEGDTLAIGEPIARIGEASEAGGNGKPSGETKEEAPAEEESASAEEDSASADEDGGEEEQEEADSAEAEDGDSGEEEQGDSDEDEQAAAQGEARGGGGGGDGGGETQAGGTATKTSAPSGNGAGDGERIKASPVARRMAGELGVELARLEGSGPGGRIVKADVQAASESGTATKTDGAQADVAEAEAPAEEGKADERREPQKGEAGPKGEADIHELTRLQQTVSRRMAESKATAPDFSISLTVDMTDAVDLRARLKEVSDPAPSFNDMVVKAAAAALREHPRVNGAYRDGKFELYEKVNIGVAVAAMDALVVPTIFDADHKSLGQISRDARAAIEKVRDKTITPPELSGGTFTVSNLGMYGIEHFTAIINPPQASILTVGALAKRPAVDDNGRVVARDQMSLSLVCDHRILYGADGAQFLARVKELLEQPLSLAL